ncbi:unnamed protein product [Pocillopora meandrina]|uniref:F5/8 type C domain-containing protein n=1 Tax=Pocillopora meandrina TaxID=46732 RepID=A0AAU9Y397_9CNID|nr:unnamed protein product [Pocillopora meandrina]
MPVIGNKEDSIWRSSLNIAFIVVQWENESSVSVIKEKKVVGAVELKEGTTVDILTGTNKGRMAHFYHQLNPPIKARYIKLRPTSWYDHISLRMELYGCSVGKQGGWSARQNNKNQWIQVALGSYTKLTSIATQGRNAYSQWVTAYKLQYSEDGVNFYFYKVPGQSSPKVFRGNKDRDSIVYHQLNPPIKARYIKLRPTAWYGHISLRMELYGCSVGMIVVLHLFWH